jgi:hypothetical protein
MKFLSKLSVGAVVMLASHVATMTPPAPATPAATAAATAALNDPRWQDITDKLGGLSTQYGIFHDYYDYNTGTYSGDVRELLKLARDTLDALGSAETVHTDVIEDLRKRLEAAEAAEAVS